MYKLSTVSRKAILVVCVAGCTSIMFNPEWRALVAASYEGVLSDPTRTTRKEQEVVGERLEKLREEAERVLPKRGVFATATYTDIDRDTTIREQGYDGTLLGITVGGDYRLRRNLVLGIAAAASNQDDDIKGNAGNREIDSFSFSLYGSYYPIDNSYIDFLGGFKISDYDTERDVSNTSIRGDYDGFAIQAALNAGFDYNIEAFTFGPRLETSYVYFNNDDLVEENGPQAVRVEGEENDSLLVKIGGDVRRAISFDWGVLIPQATLFYQHEFLNDSQSLEVTNISSGETGSFLTDNPDRNTFIGRLGFVATMPKRVRLFINYEQLFSHSYLKTKTVNFGARIDF